jgi:hypothetical protein
MAVGQDFLILQGKYSPSLSDFCDAPHLRWTAHKIVDQISHWTLLFSSQTVEISPFDH